VRGSPTRRHEPRLQAQKKAAKRMTA